MSNERTEQPTQKKVRDAREKGQVARSRDLALVAASVAATVALARLGGHVISALTERVSADLAHFGDAPLRTLTGPDVTAIAHSGMWLLTTLIGPVALATMVAGVGMHGFQGGWVFSPGALQWKWSRLSPASGMKRFGNLQAGVDTLKAFVSVAAMTYLGWLAVRDVTADSLRLAWLSPADAAITGWTHIESLLWRVSFALGALALGDYALQAYRLHSSLKMTRQEVRDEARSQEGSVEVKGRVRKIQREMARRRMMSDVKKATVVIMNPTHFAVALEYRRDSMPAPRVLAKGRDHLALRIRDMAREHGIPIVENKPLAQMLFKTTEVGDTIPAPMFAAVAEVLAYLVRIKQLML